MNLDEGGVGIRKKVYVLKIKRLNLKLKNKLKKTKKKKNANTLVVSSVNRKKLYRYQRRFLITH